jgi:outer membrane protein assembly factor BamB
VVCLERTTGKKLWDSTVSVGKPKYNTHASNTFATETPVSDGERVFAWFGASGMAVAYDLEGKELWKTEIGAFPNQNGWGTASSPVIHDGRLFIQSDNEEKSFLVALDAKNGKELWKTPRSEKTDWSTPYLWKTRTRTDLVVAGSQKLCGYDPESGKVVWDNLYKKSSILLKAMAPASSMVISGCR